MTNSVLVVYNIATRMPTLLRVVSSKHEGLEGLNPLNLLADVAASSTTLNTHSVNCLIVTDSYKFIVRDLL